MSEPHRRYTLAAQIACARREIALRKKAYPKWVEKGWLKPEAADHEIHCMQAIHDTLCELQQEKGPL